MDDSEDFDPEMHGADWAEVYERQAERADLVPRYCDLLDLEAGDDVLEIGSGPGYASVRLAERVAPGTVYALDRQPGALRYLLGEAAGDGNAERVRPLVGDAGALPVRFRQPTPVLASLVLHHVDAPGRAIGEVAAAVPPASPFLVVEYYLDAPEGPPEDHRIPPARIREWLSEAGFTVETETDVYEGMYALLSSR